MKLNHWMNFNEMFRKQVFEAHLLWIISWNQSTSIWLPHQTNLIQKMTHSVKFTFVVLTFGVFVDPSLSHGIFLCDSFHKIFA